MNEDVIADLKQFITATVSQQTAEVVTRIEKRLGTLERKIDDLQSSVSEAITASNDAVHEQLQDHGHRLTALEQSRA